MSRPGRIAVDRPYALVDGRGYALTSQGAGAGILLATPAGNEIGGMDEVHRDRSQCARSPQPPSSRPG
jgi:hypothetical protein